MAEQRDEARGHELRGGTEGGDTARTMDANLRDEGTRGHTAPSGGVHVEPPAQYRPRTDLAGRDRDGGDRLAGGKTADDVRGYLGGIRFPARKDQIIHAARQAGAPDDVVAHLGLLPANDYDSAEAMLRDFPDLPDRDAVGSPSRLTRGPGAHGDSAGGE